MPSLFAAVVVVVSVLTVPLGLRPRFLFTAFPVTITLGRWVREPQAPLVVGLSADALAAVTVAVSTDVWLVP